MVMYGSNQVAASDNESVASEQNQPTTTASIDYN